MQNRTSIVHENMIKKLHDALRSFMNQYPHGRWVDMNRWAAQTKMDGYNFKPISFHAPSKPNPSRKSQQQLALFILNPYSTFNFCMLHICMYKLSFVSIWSIVNSLYWIALFRWFIYYKKGFTNTFENLPNTYLELYFK